MQLPDLQYASTTDHSGEKKKIDATHKFSALPKTVPLCHGTQIIHFWTKNPTTCFSPDNKLLHPHYCSPLPTPCFFTELFPNKFYSKPCNTCYWKKPPVVWSVVSTSTYKLMHTGTKAHNDKASSCPLTVARKYQPFLPISAVLLFIHFHD